MRRAALVERRPEARSGWGVRMLAGAACVLAFCVGPASAETLTSALAQAYANNPTLNAERSSLRAVDELVPQALSGFRPQVFGSGQVFSSIQSTRPSGTTSNTGASAGVTIEQPLYRGNRTVNSVRQAEATVRAGREALRNVEQNILFAAVEAFMNVLRDEAIVELRRRSLEVLREELRATQDRFDVGEVTRTDVAQAEAGAARAMSDLNFAQADLMSSRATYREVVGRDPSNLQPARPATGLPGALDVAVQLGRSEHPAILSATHAEEASAFAVSVAEGALLPSLSLQGTFDVAASPSPTVDRSAAVAIVAQLSIPIYQGGFEYSEVRAAKQVRTQRTLEIDVARQQVHAAVLSAWGSLEAATASINSARTQVSAAEIAFEGVREEAAVGQRTTVDVLNAERELLDARVTLVIAERDQVVASFALMSAIGRLDAGRLGLAVAEYHPEQHYEQVRDRWFGLRTPSAQ